MFDSTVFFRIIKNGLKGYWRNMWLSTAATLVMVITLIILSILLVLYGVTNYTVKTVKERVDISVYFKNTITEPQVLKIKEELEANNLIKQISYVSAEEALKEFKAKQQNNPDVLVAIEELGSNPLPATLQIKAKEISDYPAVADFINQDKYKDYVEKVNFEDNRQVIEKLGQTLEFIVLGGLVLGIIFSIIAILVIFNTLALTIYNRKEEIEIMRLVGATNSYIRGPFIIEAFLYSLGATIITGALFVPVFIKIMPIIIGYISPESYNMNFFSIYTNIYNLPISNFWLLLLFQLLTSLLLTILSSYLAMRKYLQV